MKSATCSAPVNIAVVKYWGRSTRGERALILPANSSLSVTLSQDDLASVTTIAADPTWDKDRLWLNGKEEFNLDTGRVGRCLSEMRRLRAEHEQAEQIQDNTKPLSQQRLHIVSSNNFPTAAGLASSASGYAALVSTLAALFELPISPSDLSRIARQGSGSACRSIFGGYVAWQAGTAVDGSDSLAVQVAPLPHWPEMEALICVVSAAKKDVPSTAGMQRSIETSPLLQHRVAEVAPKRMETLSKAIQDRNFTLFANETMADSNSFHACCLDTQPPIFYMNDTSRAIISLIVELNRASGKPIAAYTFDAGPNAVLYALSENMPIVAAAVSRFFAPAEPFTDAKGLLKQSISLPEGFEEAAVPRVGPGSVKQLIHTRVGDGPRRLPESHSLIGPDGLPRSW